MPNIIKVTAENPDELLNTGAYGSGALIRVQSATTETGTYADLSGLGSTPTIPIVTLVRAYTAYDPNGTSSTWYRTRYENAGGSRVSDWSTAFQVGDETAGLLCSLYDVKQELGNVTPDPQNDEALLEKISQVSTAIMNYTGRWFARRPSSGTATWYFNVKRPGSRFQIPQGIVSVASVEVATFSQPASGGTYSTIPSTDWFLHPLDGERDYGWPATEIVLTNYPTSGAASYFYAGYNALRVVGQLGWPSVPADIQGVAVRAVVRRDIGKGVGGASVAVGPAGTEFLLPDMSGADRAVLDWYRVTDID